MKTIKIFFVLIAFIGLLFLSCSDNTFSPISPTDQTKVISNVTNLDKNGPLTHSVEGSGLLTSPEGKNLGARYAAHQYKDGSFGGDYEINCANAVEDPTFKFNGNVLMFKIYENVGEYGGKMAVFLGQEKTEILAGWYDLFFAIDNGIPGQTSNPDQVNYWLISLPSLDYKMPAGWGPDLTDKTIQEAFEQLTPEQLISNLGILDCDKGNITIE